MKPVSIRLRRSWYCGGASTGALRHLPAIARRSLKLDDDAAVGSRRLEIGGGPHPEPGYIHVDADPSAHHLEAIASAWQLPFADGWAVEIRAIHVLEHVPPPRLLGTLGEWHRVLAPGGRVTIHVPNTAGIARAYERVGLPEKWAVMGAMLGMYADPQETRSPEALTAPADHQLLFDWGLLSWSLQEAGFEGLRDLTGQVEDRHTAGWRELVPHISLVATAVKPPGPTGRPQA